MEKLFARFKVAVFVTEFERLSVTVYDKEPLVTLENVAGFELDVVFPNLILIFFAVAPFLYEGVTVTLISEIPLTTVAPVVPNTAETFASDSTIA